MNADKFLARLINVCKDAYSAAGKNDSIELEIRFKDITKDIFVNLYESMKNSDEFSSPTLDCTMNTISENVFESSSSNNYDTSQYIRKLTFVKGVVSNNEYLSKKKLSKPVHVNDYIRYSVGLAKETKISEFASAPNSLVRFKSRVSFEYKASTPARWRFDLTAIRHGALSSLGPILKRIKNAMFPPSMTAENFINEINFDEVNGFELEIEFIGPIDSLSVEELNVAKTIFVILNPEYVKELAYKEEIYNVAKHIIDNEKLLALFKNKYGQRQLSNQVISISKNTYYKDIYPPTGYFLTDKTDGQRAILSIHGNKCRILLSTHMLEYTSDSGDTDDITNNTDDITNNNVYIFDAEMLPDGKTFWVFDAMFYEKNIAAEPFIQRLKYIEKAPNVMLPFKLDAKVKTFIRLEPPFEDKFKEIYLKKHEYETDGLIITEPDKDYFETRNYKWKPYDLNTIDFLAIKCPAKLKGIKPYIAEPNKELYLLFVGISHTMRTSLGIGLLTAYKSIFPDADANYYPIQFSPSANPLAYIFSYDGDIHGKIVELKRNTSNTNWEFLRIREDRKIDKHYYGNDYKTAELTYMNFIDPFNFDALWKDPSSYFTKTADTIYTAPNKYKRYVISDIFKNNLSGLKRVIDLASGRGADLHRYQEIGVGNVLFIDADATAISELIRRKFSYFKKKIGGLENNLQYNRIQSIDLEKIINKDTKSLTIYTLVADLKQPNDHLLAAVSRYGFMPDTTDAIVCNFAFHYFCDSVDNMREVLTFVSKSLKPGGKFIFTVMNGQKIFDLLKDIEQGKKWVDYEEHVQKYGFIKKYNSIKLSASGQLISVLLPFTDEWVDEPLCNIDTVISEARKLKLEVELNNSFTKQLEIFKKYSPRLYNLLTESDKKYIDLFQYVSFSKIN